ncbi:MAG: DUF4468 domain-containing protein [Bacteroidales bacterium]|nr:DUF4468 domain-containing protein [Bacteroidales bacterium]
MKKIFLAAAVILAVFVANAQKNNPLPVPDLPIDERTNLVTYQDVVKQDGASPQVLYDRAMDWAKKFYKNTAEVIKNADREKGVLDMRSSVRIFSKQKDGTLLPKNIVYYNFKLECRDGRYRYTITNFNEKAASAAPIENWFKTDSPYWSPSQYEWLNQIDEQVKALINSLEDGMLPPEVIEDEW